MNPRRNEIPTKRATTLLFYFFSLLFSFLSFSSLPFSSLPFSYGEAIKVQTMKYIGGEFMLPHVNNVLTNNRTGRTTVSHENPVLTTIRHGNSRKREAESLSV